MDSGFTKVGVYVSPQADGAPITFWDIPTALIPAGHRNIGSCLIISGEHPDPRTPIGQMRLAVASLKVAPCPRGGR